MHTRCYMGAGDLVAKDVEKGDVHNVFFASVFTSYACLQQSQVPETHRKICSKEDIPFIGEVQVCEYVTN